MLAQLLLWLACAAQAGPVAKAGSPAAEVVGGILRAVPPQWHAEIGSFLAAPGYGPAALTRKLQSLALDDAAVPGTRASAALPPLPAALSHPGTEAERLAATEKLADLVAVAGPYIVSPLERARLAEAASSLGRALTPEHQARLAEKMRVMAAALGWTPPHEEDAPPARSTRLGRSRSPKLRIPAPGRPATRWKDNGGATADFVLPEDAAQAQRVVSDLVAAIVGRAAPGRDFFPAELKRREILTPELLAGESSRAAQAAEKFLLGRSRDHVIWHGDYIEGFVVKTVIKARRLADGPAVLEVIDLEGRPGLEDRVRGLFSGLRLLPRTRSLDLPHGFFRPGTDGLEAYFSVMDAVKPGWGAGARAAFIRTALLSFYRGVQARKGPEARLYWRIYHALERSGQRLESVADLKAFIAAFPDERGAPADKAGLLLRLDEALGRPVSPFLGGDSADDAAGVRWAFRAGVAAAFDSQGGVRLSLDGRHPDAPAFSVGAAANRLEGLAHQADVDAAAQRLSVLLERASPPPTRGALLRDLIWEKRILPSAYSKLPEDNGGWRNALKALWSYITMGRTFDSEGDELPPGRHGFKLLHPFGSVAKVQFHALPGHPFTGLFADADVPGLMRLSLGAPEKSGKFIPGVGLKLFRDDHPSANAVLLGEVTGVDGQQPDKNFMAQTFTNILPKPKSRTTRIAAFILGLRNRGNALDIPVDHFAELGADGTEADEPVAPYRLLLKPAPGLGNPSDTKREFRETFEDLPIGRVFEVYASEGPDATPILVGTIETVSEFVASEYGDKGLFFRHRRGRSKPTWRARLKAGLSRLLSPGS